LRATLATRSRTSCVAASMSRLNSNVTMTNEAPGPLIERNSLMPATVLMASSMGYESSASTSAGDAPGNRVLTRTVGKSTEGKRSTPRFE
jgi:hypothetical protein